MSDDAKGPVSLLAADAPGRGFRTNYPESFASRMAGRDKRPIGDLFGLTNFGVNIHAPCARRQFGFGARAHEAGRVRLYSRRALDPVHQLWPSSASARYVRRLQGRNRRRRLPHQRDRGGGRLPRNRRPHRRRRGRLPWRRPRGRHDRRAATGGAQGWDALLNARTDGRRQGGRAARGLSSNRRPASIAFAAEARQIGCVDRQEGVPDPAPPPGTPGQQRISS
jgi:hypothetical protein